MNYLINRSLTRNLFSLNSLICNRSAYVTTSEQPAEITKAEPNQVDPNAVLDDLFKKVVVEVRGHDPSVLESYENYVKMAAQELDVKLTSVRTPFRFIERWTILKSRFSNRKHMRQYEMRTHFKEFEFIHLTGSTRDTLLEYIQRNLPEGVAMHVHETKILELPKEFTNKT
jgi:small subunit ribosomal protein S10